MALNRDFVGRTYASSTSYEVSRVKIREFAAAIGDNNPIYRDKEAARAAGHPDVVAPPTFPIVFTLSGGGEALADPGLGLNFAMVVHGEQRFEYVRPIYAGDELVTSSTITDIRSAGRNELLTFRSEVRTLAGEHVCTSYNTIVERGGAGS
ncbi:MaoC family dehydratase N-terminal domain-containing protein [Nonomuraea sp. NPDC050556]|uniref:MaoC family dehydratase N-terminal domain-containing protein n=1 Tax=Nonomuraea sp. NPDC050556 TaxID=3364369 RepID=UPI0037A246DC